MVKGKVGLGRRGEHIVARSLSQRGFTTVERNWHCPFGEADLVLYRGGEWYFVEVRTRRGATHAVPEQSMKPDKVQRMEQVARTYVGLHVSALDPILHLSFAAVEMDQAGHLRRVTFYSDLNGPPITLFKA